MRNREVKLHLPEGKTDEPARRTRGRRTMEEEKVRGVRSVRSFLLIKI